MMDGLPQIATWMGAFNEGGIGQRFDICGFELGVQCRDGVVLAVEKPVGNKMLVTKTTGGGFIRWMNMRVWR